MTTTIVRIRDSNTHFDAKKCVNELSLRPWVASCYEHPSMQKRNFSLISLFYNLDILMIRYLIARGILTSDVPLSPNSTSYVFYLWSGNEIKRQNYHKTTFQNTISWKKNLLLWSQFLWSGISKSRLTTPALIQIMARRLVADRPLSEPMMIQFIDAYRHTRPKPDKGFCILDSWEAITSPKFFIFYSLKCD